MTRKIFFWLFNDILHFGIAKYLKNQENELYAIFDTTDRMTDFFQNQKIIQFNKAWFFHNYMTKNNTKLDIDYLSLFEQKYNINLWLLAYNERIFTLNNFHKFDKLEIMSILEQECKLFEMILNETNPDFVIMPPPNFHHDYIFYHMCKAKKIRVLMLGYSRFGKRSIITSEPDKIDEMLQNNSSGPMLSKEQLIDYLKGYDYFKSNVEYTKNFMSSKLELLKAIFSYLLFSKNNKKNFTYYGRNKIKVLIKTGILTIKELYRENFLNKNSDKNVECDNFVYFPMQLDQENSLLLGAPFHINQLEIIKNIAKSLPVGFVLCVKEHPVMKTRGWRNISYYKEILQLYNVKLLHPTVSNEAILQNCSAVITISSTAGMEAAFYGKPSIVMVDVLYSSLPSVLRLLSIDQLPQMIQAVLKKQVNSLDVNKFVNMINNNSISFDLFQFHTEINNTFFYGGFLTDVVLTETDVISFLEKHDATFTLLANEYRKRVNMIENNPTWR